MRIVMLFIVAALLGGCATTAERAAESQREAAAMKQVYGPACIQLGYQADSDAWRNCILRLDARDSYLRGYPAAGCIGEQGFLHCTTY